MSEAGLPMLGGIHETALYVADLDRAAEFYREVFALVEIGRDRRRHVFLRVGHDVLLLFDASATSAPSGTVPAHGARGQQHVAFDVAPSDMDAWRRRLESLGVAVEAEVEWPRGGHSLYVRDPDGHSVELITRGVWDEG